MSISSRIRSGFVVLPAVASLWFCLFRSLVAQSPQVGYSIITAEPGTSLPAASALFTFTDRAGVVIWQAGVPASDPLQSGRIFVDQQGARTAIALVNPSAESFPVVLVIRDSAGAEAGRITRTFAARQHLSIFVDELFPGLAPGFTGTLQFETNSPSQRIAAVTLRSNKNFHGEDIFATLPVIDTGSPGGTQPLLFPQVGAGPDFSTQVVLLNRGSTRISGFIRLTGSDGLPLRLTLDSATGSEFPYQIEPNGAYRAELTSASTVGVGYAQVVPDAGSTAPSGNAIFRFRAGGQIISEAGIAAVNPTPNARIFIDTVSTRTGVAIASTESSALTVSFTLLDRNGVAIQAATRELPPRGHLAVFADELFSNLPSGFTGLMEIVSAAPVAPVTLKLSINGRSEPILTTLPIADLTRTTGSTSLVFAQIGFGDTGNGAFSTRLILINTDKTKISRGSLDFFKSDGTALRIPLSNQTAGRHAYQLSAGGSLQLRPGNTATMRQIILGPQSLSGDEVVVNESSSLTIRPLFIDSAGESRDDFEVGYTSLNPEVATIDALGKIDGRKAGFSTLLAAAGGVVASFTITVVRVDSGVAGFEITGIAQDLARRVYLAHTGDHTLLLAQDLSQAPEVYAGVASSAGLKNDERLKALFRSPGFLALNHADGTLFVSDTNNHVIRLVRPGKSGRVDTLAGDGQAGNRDGPVTQSAFNNPQGMALDNRGNLWIADSSNHTIRRINLISRTVETIAGASGNPGSSDGTGSSARFNNPTGIAVQFESLAQQLSRQASGAPPPPVTLLVADTGNAAIRRVTEDGKVDTVGQLGGTGPAGKVRRSVSSALGLKSPAGIAVDPLGNIYVADPGAGAVLTLLRNGALVPASQANTFLSPKAIAVTQSGKVLVSDSNRSARQITFGAPAIASITPDRVRNQGGTSVVIKGANFAPDSLLIIAETVVTGVQILDTQTISFNAPALRSGRTTLTVQNRGGLAQKPFLVDPVSLNELSAGQITTVVGGTTFSGDGGPAASAVLGRPEQTAVDSSGNIFIADTSNHRIRRVDAVTGVITTLAGNGVFGSSGDNGPAVAAALSFPGGIAVDSGGNLFIADTGNSRIRRVSSATATITTVAGREILGFSGDNGPAVAASLNAPNAVAVDTAGNLLIADSGNSRIRRVDVQTGVITTVAGNGQIEFSGDNVPANTASLNSPRGIAIDSSGALLIADTFHHRIRRVDAVTGLISTVAGTGANGFSGDNAPASAAVLNFPWAVAVDGNGNILIADTNNHRVRKVDAVTGTITSVAGSGTPGFSGDEGPAVSAALNSPRGVAVDSAGNLVIADRVNNRIRSISGSSGIIRTIAGNGQDSFIGDGEAATAANLKSPTGIAFDSANSLFIADSGNHRIRRTVEIIGTITTVAGIGLAGFNGDNQAATAAALNSPQNTVTDGSRNFYAADTFNHRIRKIDASGTITTIAGNGLQAFSGDNGPAATASLAFPIGIARDSSGNLFVADTGNHRIRKIDEITGIITTVAGTGESGFFGDGGPATVAVLNSPRAVAVSGNSLFIADSSNDRIRRVDLATGVITTIAGNGQRSYSGDNGAAGAAALNFPLDIDIDARGRLFIADTFNHRIRVVANGIIRTVAGNGQAGFSGDNGPASNASIFIPSGLAFDRNGNLYFSDTANDRVRAVKTPP